LNFLGGFSKNSPKQNFIEFPQVEAELINADEEMGRQTGGHEDVASLVAFHNFTNAPEKANMLFE